MSQWSELSSQEAELVAVSLSCATEEDADNRAFCSALVSSTIEARAHEPAGAAGVPRTGRASGWLGWGARRV